MNLHFTLTIRANKFNKFHFKIIPAHKIKIEFKRINEIARNLIHH